MAEKRKENKRSELLRELIGMYQPQSVGDITDMLKDLFADTMEDMLKAELEAKLGYRRTIPPPRTPRTAGTAAIPKPSAQAWERAGFRFRETGRENTSRR